MLDSMLLLLLEFFFLIVLNVVGPFAIVVDTMCYMHGNFLCTISTR